MLAVGVPRRGLALGLPPRRDWILGTFVVATLASVGLFDTRVVAQATGVQAGAPAATQAPPTAAAPAPAAAEASPTAATPAAEVAQTEAQTEEGAVAWDLLHRRYASWSGPTGGISIIDASTGEPGAVRIQLGLDAFYGSDYLQDGDEISVRDQAFALSVTVASPVEVYVSLGNRGATQTDDDGASRELDTLGDFLIGTKLAAHLGRALWLAGDVRAQLGGQVGDSGLALGSTSIGLRGAFTVDLQELEKPIPFVARINAGYLIDNSANLVSDVETQRYEALGNDAQDEEDETRHLVNRFERLAFDINRVDRFTIGVGFEAPLQLGKNFFLHPLLEWTFDIPVNRQDYDCPYVVGDDDVGTPSSTEDSCFERDPSVAPMNLLFGVRIVPPLRGASLLLGADIGLTGTDFFVRELAPNLPYRVLIAFSYDYDARPAAPPPVAAAAPAPAIVAAPTGRLRGAVTTPEGVGVVGAVVTFVGKPVSALSSALDGSFVSEPFEPGDIQISVSHPDYEPGSCAGTIPPGGGDVAVRCVVVARPKVGRLSGRISDMAGAAVAGARVALLFKGATAATPSAPAPSGAAPAPTPPPATGTGALLSTDGSGRFDAANLQPGEYELRVEATGYFIRISHASVVADSSSLLELPLTRKPATPSIMLRADNLVEAPTIVWQGESTELGSGAQTAVAELAELLLTRADLRVRIQGYGSDLVALPRALAVKRRLVDAGVDESRIEAIGGSGQTRVRILLLP